MFFNGWVLNCLDIDWRFFTHHCGWSMSLKMWRGSLMFVNQFFSVDTTTHKLNGLKFKSRVYSQPVISLLQSFTDYEGRYCYLPVQDRHLHKNTVPFLTRWFTLPETNSQSTWKQKWCWKTILSFLLRRLLGRLLLLFIHGSKLPEFSPVTIIRLSGKTCQEIPSCKVGSCQLWMEFTWGPCYTRQLADIFPAETGVK